MDARARIAAVILAGGRGERLGGVNKAEVMFGGERLIDRALRVASGCDPILVAVGPTAYVPPGGHAIPDLSTEYAGPLAGVAVAVAELAAGDAEWLLSLAVDTPFFPADFLARATARADGIDCVMGCFGAQDYPTNALWRLDAVRDLPEAVRVGTAPRSLKRLAATVRTTRLDYAELVADDPFLNANTREDLEKLALRLSPTNAP
jgi:molybdopterin-guanine dinucleotide biosynthesis protein A